MAGHNQERQPIPNARSARFLRRTGACSPEARYVHIMPSGAGSLAIRNAAALRLSPALTVPLVTMTSPCASSTPSGSQQACAAATDGRVQGGAGSFESSYWHSTQGSSGGNWFWVDLAPACESQLPGAACSGVISSVVVSPQPVGWYAAQIDTARADAR